jgi:myo-inositol-1(or 4)-monophosphatase
MSAAQAPISFVVIGVPPIARRLETRRFAAISQIYNKAFCRQPENRAMDELAARFEAGLAATRAAGARARDFFERRRSLVVETKGAQDFVSVADREVEELLAGGLRAAFPGDAVLGEEHGRQGQGSHCWVIDPIDGTSNFVRGIALWCVSVGLLVDNVPTLGFVYDPVRDEMFAGRRGAGATCNGRPMTASAAGVERARINLGFGLRQSPERFATVMQRLVAQGAEFSRFGSAAISLAYVADGRLEGFWEHRINAWDVCAGLVLAAEAGAVVEDFFAGDGPARTGRCVVAAPGVAAALQAAIA